MNSYQYRDISIQVFDDPTYTFGSADNKFTYSKHNFSDGGLEYPTSKHGIKIFCDEMETNNCIVIGSGGATGIHQTSSLVDRDQLLICCCDTIFCLTLPDLELKWQVRADQATCFEIYKLQDDYIVHGEIEITRLDRDGNVKWQFGGSDIFVSFDNNEAFRLNDDHIALTDFYNIKYKIDFDGKVI